MPLKIKFPTLELSLKVTLWYSLLFVVSSGLVFLFAYEIFERDLKNGDHEIIEAKLKQYEALYLKDGVGGLKKVSIDPAQSAEDSGFLVRLATATGDTVFVRVPPTPHFDIVSVEKQISKTIKPERWTTIEAVDDEDVFEIFSRPLDPDFILQVGKSSGARQEILERVQGIFAVALMVTIAVGFSTGLWFSRRLLSPVRGLIETMKTIQSGDLKARVASQNTGDELEMLTTLFNSMLDRIELLIAALREMTDNVAHDLKTPLTRLRSSAENALQNLTSVHDLREALADCIENSEEILTMVNTVMEIVDADSGAMRLKSEPYNLKMIIDQVADLYDFPLQDKSLSLSINVPQDVILNGDPVRTKQVISNLLDNAVKYAKPNGMIAITAQREALQVVIRVQDDGVGIDVADLPRIWERLYRADKSRSLPGLGLGLSLVKSIVLAQGGAVSATSASDVGSIFEVRLPITATFTEH